MSESIIMNKARAIEPVDTAKQVSEPYTINVNLVFTSNQHYNKIVVQLET